MYNQIVNELLDNSFCKDNEQLRQHKTARIDIGLFQKCQLKNIENSRKYKILKYKDT